MGKSWKNPIKVANAQKKGAIFTKFAREIQVATKIGGADPQFNARLRMAVEAAKKAGCPNDTIDRAIKKGSGQIESGQIEEIMYEGFGPHGTGILVECQTDNRHRTAPDIRVIFKKHEGSLGESGSVSWMFAPVCLIEGHKMDPGPFDPEEEAIEVGADEVLLKEAHSQEYFFYGSVENLDSIRQALSLRGWQITAAELAFKPKNITSLSPEQTKDVLELLEELDEHDDTHRVYATLPHN